MEISKITELCIEEFEKISNDESITFFDLLTKNVDINEAMFLEKTNSLFQLYNNFIKELKIRKIKFHINDCGNKTVGLPYMVNSFCKIQLVKKIKSFSLDYLTFEKNSFGELSLDKVIFLDNKIKYIRKPNGKRTQTNPYIEILIDPFASNYDNDGSDYFYYEEEFKRICCAVQYSDKSNALDNKILNIKVSVLFDNGEKKILTDESIDIILSIYKLAEKYMPVILLKK